MRTVKTYSPKAADLQPQWRVVDAEGQILGRMATQLATILKGKDKPTYTTHLPVGDYVVVINAEKVRVTGLKAQKKLYYRHTGYPGGLRAVPYSVMLARHPTRIIEQAVKGMLPHNVLGRQLLRRLKVYAGPLHPHEAQVRAGQKARLRGTQSPEAREA